MKRKFLITNDVGLSLNKVKFLVDEMKVNGGELYGEDYEEVLSEILQHLEQALYNLGDEDD